jgi:glucokinase
VILNSKLYTGSTGTAPELGHFSIRSNGVACACGNRGCFERYCSASALERLLPGYTAKEIFSRILEQPFKDVLEQFFIDLKIGLVSIANIFDPDCILLGGGLSQGIFARLPDIEDWIKHHAFPTVAAHIKIGPTKHSNQSGAIGAALLAQEN